MATQEQEKGQDKGKDKKVTLTISTLSGDYTHDVPEHQKLAAAVDQAIDKLELKGEGPWILEQDGVELNQELTIEQAELKDGDVLTLNPQEGGGGSERL
jgi:predicted RNase H-like nuclease (RuvC/YqgF family)